LPETLTREQIHFVYANEADLLNVIPEDINQAAYSPKSFTYAEFF
jgi:hypothetical protein